MCIKGVECQGEPRRCRLDQGPSRSGSEWMAGKDEWDRRAWKRREKREMKMGKVQRLGYGKIVRMAKFLDRKIVYKITTE